METKQDLNDFISFRKYMFHVLLPDMTSVESNPPDDTATMKTTTTMRSLDEEGEKDDSINTSKFLS